MTALNKVGARMNSDFNRLDDLLDKEANIVSVCYSHSAPLGDKMLGNSLDGFSEFLSNRNKDYIPQLNAYYRYFLINLLLKINQEYLHMAMQFILMRSNK